MFQLKRKKSITDYGQISRPLYPSPLPSSHHPQQWTMVVLSTTTTTTTTTTTITTTTTTSTRRRKRKKKKKKMINHFGVGEVEAEVGVGEGVVLVEGVFSPGTHRHL